MGNSSYFRFDDDDKTKYIYSLMGRSSFVYPCIPEATIKFIILRLGVFSVSPATCSLTCRSPTHELTLHGQIVSFMPYLYMCITINKDGVA